MLAAAASPAPPAPPPSSGLQLVQTYNARNFGSPGWRRVGLVLKSGEEVTRRFRIVNLWRQDAGVVRTVFVLEAPEGLRGTNYLLIEDPGCPGLMEVFLHLPAGKRRVLSIEPSTFDEGLLGSDFGYRDLRMKIPTCGFHFERSGETVIQGRPAWVVTAEPATSDARRTTSWARSVLYFAKESPMLVGADFFGVDDPTRARKALRVLGWRQINGAWTETVMVMTGQDGHSSTLSLEDARFGIADLQRSLFAREALPTLGERVRRGDFPIAAEK